MAEAAGCVRGTQDIWQAAGFKITEQTMLEFMELVHSYWSEANFPSLHKRSEWKVHLLKPSKWFKHHSLLVESIDTGECFTIELVVSITSVMPFTRRFDMGSESHSHLEAVDLGRVSLPASQLFKMALNCLQDFGNYHKVTNNCQAFCQILAKRLGCSPPMTDAQKGVVAGVGVAVGVATATVLAAKAISWLFGKTEESQDSKRRR